MKNGQVYEKPLQLEYRDTSWLDREYPKFENLKERTGWLDREYPKFENLKESCNGNKKIDETCN